MTAEQAIIDLRAKLGLVSLANWSHQGGSTSGFRHPDPHQLDEQLNAVHEASMPGFGELKRLHV